MKRKWGVFEVREVGLRRRSLAQIPVFSVWDYPNYFNVLRADWHRFVHEPEALADRISAWEVVPGETLVDDSVSVMTPVAPRGGLAHRPA